MRSPSPAWASPPPFATCSFRPLRGLPDGLSFNLDDEGKVVYAPATEEYKEF
ncbi:MAG: hypothetical protein ACLR7U_11085 [Ruthenibacterium lactatiformans]